MSRVAGLALLACLLTACGGPVERRSAEVFETPWPPDVRLTEQDRAVIVERYRKEIPGRMAEAGLPGLALALVDRGGPRWIEGFGHLGEGLEQEVDGDTLFSLQSTSKVVTAFAVLTAVQDGLLDLDVPITEYLPDFTVQSRFEADPAGRMTLRQLLSHQAGFTHEAPVGNNFVPVFESFEAHIESIQRTWLRYPVGSHNAYSNLGVDLAGAILGVVTGKPFPAAVRERVLEPAGMARSSFDWDAIEAADNRAVGSWRVVKEMPLRFAMIPSGGLYASARDMGAFLTMQLNDGRVAGRTLLAPELLQEMRTPQFTSGQELGYGLGLRRYERWGLPYHEHSGAGFGFKSHFAWYPSLGIGIVVLTNSMDQSLVHQLGREVIDSVKEAMVGEERVRPQPFAGLVPMAPQPPAARRLLGLYLGRGTDRFSVMDGGDGLALDLEDEEQPLSMVSPTAGFIDWGGGKRELFRFRLDPSGAPQMAVRVRYGWTYDFDHGPEGPPAGPDRPGWAAYLGRFQIVLVDGVLQEVEIKVENGNLMLDDDRMVVEYRPGLFFGVKGEALDLRADPPTWANIPLRRVERRTAGRPVRDMAH